MLFNLLVLFPSRKQYLFFIITGLETLYVFSFPNIWKVKCSRSHTSRGHINYIWWVETINYKYGSELQRKFRFDLGQCRQSSAWRSACSSQSSGSRAHAGLPIHVQVRGGSAWEAGFRDGTWEPRGGGMFPPRQFSALRTWTWQPPAVIENWFYSNTWQRVRLAQLLFGFGLLTQSIFMTITKEIEIHTKWRPWAHFHLDIFPEVFIVS